MAILENISAKAKPVIKIAGWAILGIAAVYIAFVFLGSLFGSFAGKFQPDFGSSGVGISSSGYKSVAPAPMMESSSDGMFGFSTRNAESISGNSYYENNGTTATGDQAEKYEVTDYNASVETRQLDKTCAAISGLKAREEVIFSSAREYRNGCNYSFKVAKSKANEILALLKGMNPKELSGNTYTIQGRVDDYTSRIDILQKRLAAVDETLGKAMAFYDEVARVATNASDAESLAKVINGKVSLIERLAQERTSINSQLDQIQRAKSQQLDRLDYTYFTVNISRVVLVDWQSLKDSWNYAVKNAASEINRIVQNMTINLVSFLFWLLQYTIYALILLVAAKYGWKLVKKIWRG